LSFVSKDVNFKKNKTMKKEKKWEAEPIEEKKDSPPEKNIKEKSWSKKCGELAIDVYSTEDHIFIQAPISGVKKEDLEIVTENDIVIIKGKRERPQKKEIKEFYTKECFYGNFRRELILPEETDPSRIEANIEEGILTIEIPKIEREKRRKIDV
jgi:HSP20 family protein